MNHKYLIQNGYRSGTTSLSNPNLIQSVESCYSSISHSGSHKYADISEEYIQSTNKTLQLGDNQASCSQSKYAHEETSSLHRSSKIYCQSDKDLLACENPEFSSKNSQCTTRRVNEDAQSYPSLENIIKAIDPQALKKEALQTARSVQFQPLSPKMASVDNNNEQASANSNTTKDNSRSNISITTESVFRVERKPIIVMKVDLGAGRRDEIHLYDGDDPAKVAFDFCYKNQLENKVIEPLTRNISYQMSNYLKQKEDRLRQRSSSRGPPVTNSTFNDSSFNQSTSRTLTDKEEPEDLGQRASNVLPNENRLSLGFEVKPSADTGRAKTQGIKFELQNDKELRTESPQLEKEVRRELFREVPKRCQEYKFDTVYEEDSPPPPLQKKSKSNVKTCIY